MPTIFLPFDSPYFRRPLLAAIPDDAPALILMHTQTKEANPRQNNTMFYITSKSFTQSVTDRLITTRI